MQGNVLGQSGSSSSGLNVYAQLAEPSKKDGVWIKTEETKSNNQVNYEKISDLPYDTRYGNLQVIGTDVYLFCTSNNTDNQKQAYKYNTITNISTKLKDIPYNFYGGKTAVVGTDIYLFSSNTDTYKKYAYKYDTLTDTYNKLRDIPYQFYGGKVIAVGEDIYLLGSNTTNYSKTIYKYNTTKNTYTQLSNMPYSISYSVLEVIGTDIYIFGATTSYNCKIIKYDTVENTYTELCTISESSSFKTVTLIGTNAYITFGFNLYKYDMLQQNAIKIQEVPINIRQSVIIEGDIIFFGNSGNYGFNYAEFQRQVYKYKINKNEIIKVTELPNEFEALSILNVENNIFSFNCSEVYKLSTIIFPEKIKYKYNKICIIAQLINTYNKLPNIIEWFDDYTSAVVGTDIFLFGSNSTFFYKYDTITCTFIKLINVPLFSKSSAVAIGTNIYIFGYYGSSTDNKNQAYKYDTLTGTFSKLIDMPYYYYDGSLVNIGTDIYIFGGGETDSNKYVYKYNTLTNTYTQLTDLPTGMQYSTSVVVGTDIYIFSNLDYRYNTLTDTYTQITHKSSFSKAIAIGTDIYLLGNYGSGNYISCLYAYKYDVLKDEYIRLPNLPYKFCKGTAVTLGTNIYIFSTKNTTDYVSTEDKYNAYIYSIPKYEEDTIYVLANAGYKTVLSKTQEINILTANIYDNNRLLEYPVYYGNGQEWIKI